MGSFVLRALFYPAEHLAACREVEARSRAPLVDRGQQAQRAVDVHVERRESIFERVADEALRGEMVAFVRLQPFDEGEQARVAFERTGVQRHPVDQVPYPTEAMLPCFERRAPRA